MQSFTGPVRLLSLDDAATAATSASSGNRAGPTQVDGRELRKVIIVAGRMVGVVV